MEETSTLQEQFGEESLIFFGTNVRIQISLGCCQNVEYAIRKNKMII